jgi:exo-beta-1,3-glucanase (GH17 family)
MRRPWKFVLSSLAWAACLSFGLVLEAAEPRKIASLSYSPSGVATWADMESGISEARIRTDLQRLKPHTDAIRTYNLDHGLDRVPAIAQEMGLKVSLGLWLDKDRGKNASQIARAIKLLATRPAAVNRIYVGNEAILRGDLPPAEVIAAIAQIRAGLPKDWKVEITTAEPWHVWLKYPELGRAVDVIGAHIFPSHDGVPISYGMKDFEDRYTALTQAFPGKRVLISETGWPLAGKQNQAAEASADNAATFVRAFLRAATERRYDYSLVEAYDQPWKAADENGAMWGLFTDDGKPKFNLFAN